MLISLKKHGLQGHLAGRGGKLFSLYPTIQTIENKMIGIPFKDLNKNRWILGNFEHFREITRSTKNLTRLVRYCQNFAKILTQCLHLIKSRPDVRVRMLRSCRDCQGSCSDVCVFLNLG